MCVNARVVAGLSASEDLRRPCRAGRNWPRVRNPGFEQPFSVAPECWAVRVAFGCRAACDASFRRPGPAWRKITIARSLTQTRPRSWRDSADAAAPIFPKSPGELAVASKLAAQPPVRPELPPARKRLWFAGCEISKGGERPPRRTERRCRPVDRSRTSRRRRRLQKSPTKTDRCKTACFAQGARGDSSL
jgi:hypothetical protein